MTKSQIKSALGNALGVIVALIMRQPLSADSPDLEIRCCIRSEDIVCEVRDSYKTLHLDLAMTTINGNVNDVH